jgi:mannose-6-phosphate isomerase-like protein (cupin superfamily)
MKQYDIKSDGWNLLPQGKGIFIGIRREVKGPEGEIRYEPHNHNDTGLSEAFYLLGGQAILYVNEEELIMEPSKIYVVEPHEDHRLLKSAGSIMDILVMSFKTE